MSLRYYPPSFQSTHHTSIFFIKCFHHFMLIRSPMAKSDRILAQVDLCKRKKIRRPVVFFVGCTLYLVMKIWNNHREAAKSKWHSRYVFFYNGWLAVLPLTVGRLNGAPLQLPLPNQNTEFAGENGASQTLPNHLGWNNSLEWGKKNPSGLWCC